MNGCFRSLIWSIMKRLPIAIISVMNKEVEIDIERYNSKGHGIGHHNNKKIEVMSTAVGDRVRTEVLKKRKGIYLSQLREVITCSSDRVEPLCKHVGVCGGCSLQQLNYPKQLEIKSNRIRELFPNADIAEIIPCRSPWAYRNKMEYTFSENKAGEKFLGLIIARSRSHVINLDECHLTSSWFIDTLKRVKDWWDTTTLQAYHHYSNTGTLRNLILREGIQTGDKMVILTVSGHSDYAPSQPDLDSFKALFSTESIFLKIHQIQKGKPTQFFEVHLNGPEHLTERLNHYVYKISPSAFFQPNTLQAERLYEAAVKMPVLSRDSVVFDLYCGIASLGMTFAPYVKKVLGIELNPYAVFDARQNLDINQIKNMEVLQGDVGKVLLELSETPDLIIIDPPRSGLEERAIKLLLRLKPSQILYVSCNPKTQARDIELLKGYRLQKVQPVDQFPQTPHLENISYLTLDFL